MFQAVSLPIIRSSKTVHTASGICQACLLLPLARVSWNFQLTHVNALRVSGGFSTHHQEFKTVQIASGICQACLLLPLEWVSWKFQFPAHPCQCSSFFRRFLRPSSGAPNCTHSIGYMSSLLAVTASEG